MKNIDKHNKENLDTTTLKSEGFDLIIESIEFNNFKVKSIRLNLNVVLVIAVIFLLSITIY